MDICEVFGLGTQCQQIEQQVFLPRWFYISTIRATVVREHGWKMEPRARNCAITRSNILSRVLQRIEGMLYLSATNHSLDCLVISIAMGRENQWNRH